MGEGLLLRRYRYTKCFDRRCRVSSNVIGMVWQLGTVQFDTDNWLPSWQLGTQFNFIRNLVLIILLLELEIFRNFLWFFQSFRGLKLFRNISKIFWDFRRAFGNLHQWQSMASLANFQRIILVNYFLKIFWP